MYLKIHFILLKKNNKGICRLSRSPRIVFSGVFYLLFFSISGPYTENMKRCPLIWDFKCTKFWPNRAVGRLYL